MLYDLLSASASATLLAFGRNNLGAELGLTAVLHTWSQTLLDHYHLHCIVTGGRVSLDGTRWVGSRPDYLLNVTALSQVFRAKFCEGLQALYAAGQLEFQSAIRVRQQAERILREELPRLGCQEEQLLLRRKGDAAKVAIARRLKKQTTLSLQEIADRLRMGSWTYVSNLLTSTPRPTAPQPLLRLFQ